MKESHGAQSYVAAFCVGLGQAYLFQFLLRMTGVDTLFQIVAFVLPVWTCFSVLPAFTHAMFDTRGLGFLCINQGHDLIAAILQCYVLLRTL